MSYKLRYHINWLSIEDDVMRIEILKEGYNGEAEELTPSANPLTVQFSSSDEFLYNPMRDSTCTIGVVGQDYLQELFATGYQQWKIVVYRNEVMVWCGFVKPEIYTQDYVSVDSEFEIQGVSSLGILDKIPFEVKGGYTSLKELMHRAIDAAKSEWNNVLIPKVYGQHNTVSSSSFWELKINESLFKDSTYYEFIEEVAKFYNWTASDWSGDLIFIDVDHDGGYYKYDLSLSGEAEVTAKELSIQELGSRGASHKIDRLGGYSKASVRVGNTGVSEIIKKQDFGSLRDVRLEPGFAPPMDGSTVLLEDGDYDMRHYELNGALISEDEWASSSSKISMGGACGKSFYYNIDDAPKNPDYKDVIFCRYRGFGKRYPSNGDLKSLSSDNKVAVFKSEGSMTLPDGVITINASLQTLFLDIMRSDGWWDNLTPYAKLGGLMHKSLKCGLKIGNLWWNGGGWVATETTFNIPLETDSKGGYNDVVDQKDMNIIPHGISGYIVYLYGPSAWTKPVAGDVEFSIYSSIETAAVGLVPSGGWCLSNLRLDFTPLDRGSHKDKYSGTNSDRVYENVVNEDYINELDEIEFRLSSYNNDGASVGKPIKGWTIFETYFSSLTGGYIRPEEHLIRRIRGQYRQPKIMLTTQLKLDKIKPHYWFTNKYNSGVRFMCVEGRIDYRFNVMDLKLIDNDR